MGSRGETNPPTMTVAPQAATMAQISLGKADFSNANHNTGLMESNRDRLSVRSPARPLPRRRNQFNLVPRFRTSASCCQRKGSAKLAVARNNQATAWDVARVPQNFTGWLKYWTSI